MVAQLLDPAIEATFWANVRATGAFFAGTDEIHQAMERIGRVLDDLSIPYALIGAMGLNAYGYRHATMAVDILITEAGLAQFKAAWLGRGYVEKFPGSRGVRDAELGVPIDFVIAGHYPGDGKPKPVRFPDPAVAAVRSDRLAMLPIERLVELKLASGLSSLDRARDLGDVVELIRHVHLPLDLGDKLDASVRDKYVEAWHAVQASRDE